IEGWLSEVGSCKSLKEQHLRRTGLQTEWTLSRQQASKIGLKGIKQWKRFQRVHMAEIAAEANRLLAVLPGHVVRKLRTALLVEIRIAPVYTGGKCVEHFQMGLCGNRGEVECPVTVLQAQFIHQTRRKS